MFHNIEREGRGVSLYITKELKPSACDAMTNNFNEAVFVECHPQNGRNLLVGLIYRSPNSSPENTEKLNSLLKQASETAKGDLILLGDYNFPEIDWSQEISNASATTQQRTFYAPHVMPSSPSTRKIQHATERVRNLTLWTWSLQTEKTLSKLLFYRAWAKVTTSPF
jgi:hypothetical protein